eukprot:Lankesteria_metandrocarpae@DN4903_c1_g1_i1.p1
MEVEQVSGLSDALHETNIEPVTSSHNYESIPTINEYARKLHDGVVHCEMHSEKGRVLLSQRQFVCGQRILSEPPLLVVQSEDNHPLYIVLEQMYREEKLCLEAMWYWCALCSIRVLEDDLDPLADALSPKDIETDEGGGDERSVAHSLFMGLKAIPRSKQEKILHLYCPEVDSPRDELYEVLTGLCLTDVVDPLLFERLLQVWVHNCFEHTYEPLGYVMYYMPSFVSHSCMPNAVWACDPEEMFVLTARLDIAPEEEIVISYVAEEVLHCPTVKRQRVLNTTKGFTCACPRCIAPVDTSRGFRCPNCLKGEIFLHAQAGYQGSANKVLPSNNRCGFIPKCKESEYSESSSTRSTVCDGSTRETPTRTSPLFESFLPNDVTVHLHGAITEMTNRRFGTTTHSLEELLDSYDADVCTKCRYRLSEDERTTLVRKERALRKAMKTRSIHKKTEADSTTASATSNSAATNTTVAATANSAAAASSTSAGAAISTSTGAATSTIAAATSTSAAATSTSTDAATIAVKMQNGECHNESADPNSSAVPVKKQNWDCVDDQSNRSTKNDSTGGTRVKDTQTGGDPMAAVAGGSDSIIDIDHASVSALTASKMSEWGNLSTLRDDTLGKLISAVVTTHHIKASWHAHLALVLVSQNAWIDVMRQLRLKLLTTQKIYPALTADKAWILEEIGDSARQLMLSQKELHSNTAVSLMSRGIRLHAVNLDVTGGMHLYAERSQD